MTKFRVHDFSGGSLGFSDVILDTLDTGIVASREVAIWIAQFIILAKRRRQDVCVVASAVANCRSSAECTLVQSPADDRDGCRG